MSFQDIHSVKRDSTPILIIEFVQGGNLPPEWRSSVAAEDEYYRLFLPQGRKLHFALVIQCRQPEVGRLITRVKNAAASARPKSLERDDKVCRHWHFRHYPTEGLRWLPHRPIDEKKEGRIATEKDNSDNNQATLGGSSHEKCRISYHSSATAKVHRFCVRGEFDKTNDGVISTNGMDCEQNGRERS